MSNFAQFLPQWQRWILLTGTAAILLASCSSANPQPTATSAITATAAPTSVSAATAAPTSAATATAAPTSPSAGVESSTIYTSTSQLFSVPIPTNWQLAEEAGIVRLNDPEQKIKIALLSVEEADLAKAIELGWQQADPSFKLTPDDSQEVPSPNGAEKTLVAAYDTKNTSQSTVAMAQLHEGVAYLMLIQGDNATITKRQSQVGIIQSGYTILALNQTTVTADQRVDVGPELISELENFIQTEQAKYKVPGVSVAIVQDGKIVYSNGFGVRDVVSQAPIDADTQLMIGSTGKSLTTLLMATLVDQGKLDWDTPVVDILPNFKVKDPERTKQITVRHLVCACTGVPRRDFEMIFNAEDLDAQGIIASVADFEFFTDFGEAFQYSNQMVAIGGFAAAAASGGDPTQLDQTFAQTLTERVLKPMGMNNTTLDQATIEASPNHALPHGLDLTSSTYQTMPISMEFAIKGVAPAGATEWSTANDMGNYLITLLNHGITPSGERLVSDQNLDVLWEPQVAIDAKTSYGLGWMISDYHGLEFIAHGGTTFGFSSEFAFIPEAKIGIVVLSNGQYANHFVTSISDRYFELAFDQPSKAAETAAYSAQGIEESLGEISKQIAPDFDPASAEPLLGNYTNPALGDVTLMLNGAELWLDIGAIQTQFKPLLNEQGEPDGYLSVTPPLTGIPFKTGVDANNQPTLTMDIGTETYLFTRKP
ncbi:serine hydrolase domain-containing protein [Herpetosiphon giganteus]|uniref:serine hydrolase domain-containing protein n=1 Tax=Herpetosiphon giganteus TaxID=2029754 RepID=UPI00195E3954|nr:serine hydrolase domain-containing protein [Herpetosiphon giganteus]MBM7846367.1 CubicO group peptidase (beta-lactamase class C family) [Herpetosiphon giganteus]